MSLFKTLSFDKFFLRDKLIYPEKWFYYFAIVANAILRFAWIVSLMPSSFVFDLAGPELAVSLGFTSFYDHISIFLLYFL